MAARDKSPLIGSQSLSVDLGITGMNSIPLEKKLVALPYNSRGIDFPSSLKTIFLISFLK
jgi:hypothetical protein